MLCPLRPERYQRCRQRHPQDSTGLFSLDKFISSGPDAQTWADRYFATVQLLFCPYYLREFQELFHGYRDTNAICPYTSIGNVVIMATGQTQQLITLFRQLPILLKKKSLK